MSARPERTALSAVEQGASPKLSAAFRGQVFCGRPARLPTGVRIGIVVSRYNESVTQRLLDGAVACFLAAGLPSDSIDVVWVPGAFELPLIADRLAASKRYASVLCLGAIIRGETSHDRHIANAVGHGIEATARAQGLPVLFGVLTCDTLAQAMSRAGGEAGNKGEECAASAIEMISLMPQLPHAFSPSP